MQTVLQILTEYGGIVAGQDKCFFLGDIVAVVPCGGAGLAVLGVILDLRFAAADHRNTFHGTDRGSPSLRKQPGFLWSTRLFYGASLLFFYGKERRNITSHERSFFPGSNRKK